MYVSLCIHVLYVNSSCVKMALGPASHQYHLAMTRLVSLSGVCFLTAVNWRRPNNKPLLKSSTKVKKEKQKKKSCDLASYALLCPCSPCHAIYVTMDKSVLKGHKARLKATGVDRDEPFACRKLQRTEKICEQRQDPGYRSLWGRQCLQAEEGEFVQAFDSLWFFLKAQRGFIFNL